MDPEKTTKNPPEIASSDAPASATSEPATTPETPTAPRISKVRVAVEKSIGVATKHDQLLKNLRLFLEYQASRFVIQHEVQGDLSLLVYVSLEK